MPLAGKGMLLTSMDVDPANERDFNLWYDGEHLQERVAIDGFLEARRYVAHAASPKYLCLYSTETFAVLDSPAYRTVLANPTPWSRTTLAHFKNTIRAVAHVTISRGQGRGAALGIVRLRPSAESKDTLRAVLTDQLDPAGLDGIISMHLIESDPELSKPINDTSSTISPGAGRLVYPGRRDAYEYRLGDCCNALCRCRRFQPCNRDFVRHLPSDVGSGEDRHPDRSLRVKHHKYIALPHEQAGINAGFQTNGEMTIK